MCACVKFLTLIVGVLLQRTDCEGWGGVGWDGCGVGEKRDGGRDKERGMVCLGRGSCCWGKTHREEGGREGEREGGETWPDSCKSPASDVNDKEKTKNTKPVCDFTFQGHSVHEATGGSDAIQKAATNVANVLFCVLGKGGEAKSKQNNHR